MLHIRQIFSKLRGTFPNRAAVSAALIFLISSSAIAQDAGIDNAAAVHLDQAAARTFKTALQALATQAHVAFVAEGTPLQPVLPPQAVPDLCVTMSAETAVQKVAAAYDYDAERQGDIFLLRKRYTNPHELPDVTLEECTLAMADVVKVLSALSPHLQPGRDHSLNEPLVFDFVRTLTPDQFQSLQSETLRVLDLSPQQRELVLRSTLYYYVQSPADDAENALRLIKQASQTALYMKNPRSRGGFGYEFRPSSSHMYFMPFDEGGPLPTINGNPLPPTPEPDRRTWKAEVPTTLGEVVAALNRRVGPRMAVDAALAAKPVTIIGARIIPTEKVLSAMAQVYGLRVKTENEILLRLTRRALRLPTDVWALSVSVRRALPPSLLRAVQDGEREKQNASPTDPDALRKWNDERYTMPYFEREVRLSLLPDTRRAEAARRLRAAYEQRQTKKGVFNLVPLVGLSETERSAFGIFLVMKFLEVVRSRLQASPPAYLSRFDELYVFGGPYQDKASGGQKFALFLGFYNPNTKKLQLSVGSSGMAYTP